MGGNPLHTATKAGADLIAPNGGFALNQVKEWDGCAACSGRIRLEVSQGTTSNKRILGYLESEYLWSLGVPDDPAEHPKTPHYIMEWVALGPDLEQLTEIDTSKSLHFAASALVRRAG